MESVTRLPWVEQGETINHKKRLVRNVLMFSLDFFFWKSENQLSRISEWWI